MIQLRMRKRGTTTTVYDFAVVVCKGVCFTVIGYCTWKYTLLGHPGTKAGYVGRNRVDTRVHAECLYSLLNIDPLVIS